MRQRVSILLVILVRLGTTCEYPKPLLRAMFSHFMSACRRFPTWLIFYFANSDRIQHGMRQSLRIGRRDNTDQLSIRSSSVLTALIAPNVRFPTLSYASRCALRAAAAAAAACKLSALPTKPSLPKTFSFIFCTIRICAFFHSRKSDHNRHLRHAPDEVRTWVAQVTDADLTTKPSELCDTLYF